jgi:tRNA(Ile)-lysidine synthase
VLLGLDAPRRARVLRAWVDALGLPPLPREGLRRIEAEVLAARRDGEPEFAWHGARVRRWRDRLHATVSVPPLDPAWSAAWSGEHPLDLPDGGCLRLVPPIALPDPVRVGARRGGERIRLAGRAHRHRLKHVLQDRGVPPWEREHLPLLTAGTGELLAAGDVVTSAEFERLLDGFGSRLLWSRPGAARR